MTTETGVLSPATATSGFPTYRQDGRLIARAIGPGSIPGDGLGWMTSLGDTLPFTMDVGVRLKAAGDGYRVQWKSRQYMRPLWSYSWAEAEGLAAIWAGFL